MPITLPESSPDGRARAAALAAMRFDAVTPTSTVEFVSRGRCVVIGPESLALAFGARLTNRVDSLIVVPGMGAPNLDVVNGITVVRGGHPLIRGALGNFDVELVAGDTRVSLGQMVEPAVERFDLVVDLNAPPLLRQAMPPLGYFAPGPDESAYAAVAQALPEMRGEFEKPKYFNYDPEICAHARNGKQACTRCLDVCPAEAIVSKGEAVEVNPYLCQGGGVCTMVCPGGAMTYAYPRSGDLLHIVQKLLADYRAAEGSAPNLLFYDASGGAALAGHLGTTMPERVLPVELEEVGSVGMDVWLAALSYGADAVVLLTSDRTAPQVIEAIQEQTAIARGILIGMGYDEECLRVINADQPSAALATLSAPTIPSQRRAARFVAQSSDKRGTLRLALHALLEQAPAPRRSVPLPAGAPFGEVRVDPELCTLCMSCVSCCPSHALLDGRGLPQLNFREWNCIQCGLCAQTCPEDAIRLSPRMLYDAEARERPRVLHEEQPVCCVACGKPFATRSLLEKLSRKLEGHWMFQTEEARRRMQMCEDCRVRDLFTAEAKRGR